MADPVTPTVVVVPVKSGWWSKINATQVVSMVATALTLFTANKYSMPTDIQVLMVATIQGMQSIATWVLRTFFTASVTPSSLPMLPGR